VNRTLSDAYEKVLQGVLSRDTSLFPIRGEVEASWLIFDAALRYLEGEQPLSYRVRSKGPVDVANELAHKHGVFWSDHNRLRH
jgi:glucose-6-phosphate 1-dehydrogenase